MREDNNWNSIANNWFKPKLTSIKHEGSVSNGIQLLEYCGHFILSDYLI